MFGILGSMVLLSNSGGQPKAIACVDLDLYMTSDQQLEESLFIDESMLVSTVKAKKQWFWHH